MQNTISGIRKARTAINPLLINCVIPAAADPVSMVPGSLETGSWCNEHMLHERLDIVEEVRGIVLAPETYHISALSF